jgi:hypothetical protein
VEAQASSLRVVQPVALPQADAACMAHVPQARSSHRWLKYFVWKATKYLRLLF